ncbi:AAA family ATPase [Methanobrevibacter curvatus]|uniref:Archaeal ATPase n=1 Tax=Methanobrevibacter curvatus TaxID=49547 RepID=A0A166CI82_9EURY|nr:ATP-binding protein [Methanobrevibacter curvatus]KZX14534.1 archaeal ATPase [Methanobrevibacter curvatus]
MEKLPWGTNSQLTANEFYNREDDIIHLKNFLETTSLGTPPTILLSGIRGIGKTALLKRVKNELKSDYLIAYLDLSHSYSFQVGELDEISLMQYIYTGWIDACEEKNFKRYVPRIKEIFKKNKFELKKIIEFGDYPIPIPETNDDYSGLLKLVLNLPQKIYEENKKEIKGVIMIIDEFQVLKDLGKNLDGFLWYFRSIIQSQRNVAYVFSGSIHSKDLIIEKIAGKTGAFGGRMLSFPINPFTENTVRKYLNEKLPSLKFKDNGFKRFYNCTQGVPYYVNTFANLLPKNLPLNDEDIKEEFKNSLPFLADHLKQVWGGLDLVEQKIITSIITGYSERKKIAENLKRTSGSLSRHLVKLQNIGLIQNISNGNYEVCETILKSWLKQEYINKGVFPYRLS